MGRRGKRESLESFNNDVVRSGVTYADIQKLETCSQMERIRAPRAETSGGRPVYMTVAARNRLKGLEAAAGEEIYKDTIDGSNGSRLCGVCKDGR